MYRWRSFLTDESGTTAIEYALILGAIILVAVATLDKLSEGSRKTFHAVDESIVIP